MNHEDVFNGTQCFLVEKYDEQSGESIINYLEEEGFRSTKWIDLPHIDSVYINVKSMCYGHAVHGVRTAFTIIDEGVKNQFRVKEFKNIWDILKKYRINKTKAENNDLKYLSAGSSCFLVKDNGLKNEGHEFWKYLKKEEFDSLNDDEISEWLLINVKNRTYLSNSSSNKILNYVHDNYQNALEINEFITIWEIIKKHEDICEFENLEEQYPSKEDLKDIYTRICHENDISDRADSCYEFKDYESIDEYAEDVVISMVSSFSYYDEKSAREVVNRSMDFIMECYEKRLPAMDVADDFWIF